MHSQAAPLGWSRAYIRWARTRQSGFGFHGIARIYQLWNVGKGVEGILENFAPRLKHTAVHAFFLLTRLSPHALVVPRRAPAPGGGGASDEIIAGRPEMVRPSFLF